VLIVTHLDPRLAPVVARLGALVAETGSALSHLAILAREYHVPTVVGVADATSRFADGQLLTVDGDAGTVVIVASDADAVPVHDPVTTGASS
jgi:pyruvate,water dikinase